MADALKLLYADIAIISCLGYIKIVKYSMKTSFR